MQLNHPVTFGDYLQIIFGQINSQLVQLHPKQSEQLILSGLIELKSDVDMNAKRFANTAIQAQFETENKKVATDGQFIVEGDRDVVKRAEKMLYMDHMINSELEKAYELFDAYAQMPMFEEFNWINKVLDVIGSSSKKADVTEADLSLDQMQGIKMVNATLERYQRTIGRREKIMDEIDGVLNKKQRADEEAKARQEDKKRDQFKTLDLSQNKLILNEEISPEGLWSRDVYSPKPKAKPLPQLSRAFNNTARSFFSSRKHHNASASMAAKSSLMVQKSQHFEEMPSRVFNFSNIKKK